ncbi:carbon-nitrogen hydrolase family protein [bacterium]|nr:carbon-nitrogen hydrolase family protein [candidate division CSSED10-310 bacterium]
MSHEKFESKTDDILTQIDASYSLGDLIATLCVSVFNDLAITEYELIVQSSKLNITKQIDEACSDFVSSSIDAKEFIDLIFDCSILEKADVRALCVNLILRLDKYYIYNENKYDKFNREPFICSGPLNVTYMDAVAIYPKPNCKTDDIYSDGMKLRKKIRHETRNINNYLHNIIILKRKVLESFQQIPLEMPMVYQLNDKHYFDMLIGNHEDINIGLAPFSKLLHVDIVESETEFEIINPKDDVSTKVSERYIQILDEMINQNIHIAIFPEIALMPSVLKSIKAHLSDRIGHSLKLIVSGSMWENNNNTAYILNGQGKEICHYNKLNPYNNENNKTEALRLREEIHDFVDIYGFGRIYFTICMDYITKSYDALTDIMGCNYIVVSAYTPSLEPFISQANDLAMSNYVISFVCNYCAALSKKIQNPGSEGICERIGFVGLPAKNKTKNEIDIYEYNLANCKYECNQEVPCFVKFSFTPYPQLYKRGNLSKLPATISFCNEVSV